MIPLRDTIPSRTAPVVTGLIIAINVLVFLHEIMLDDFSRDAFVRAYAMVPRDALAHPSSFVTSMFLHGGWLHLLGNMIFLWIFGDNVEDRLGHLRYLAFYVATGVGAALVQAHLAPDSTIPTIGASGAISGVLGAYAVLFPRARVYTLLPFVFVFFGIVEVPASVYLGLWFAMQLVNGAVGLAVPVEASGGVAWWAHIGGFVMGSAVASLLRLGQRERRRWHPEYAPW